MELFYFYGFFCVFVSEEKSGFMGLLEIELVTGFLVVGGIIVFSP